MCGFTITKKPSANYLSHRGVSQTDMRFKGWNVIFNSLPLSSYETGIEQPVVLGSYLMVFNGEIFNYKELDPTADSDVHYLRQILKDKGVEGTYKESLKWDGFWSIGIINSKGELFFFTDPLGKKQLYSDGTGIASEIKPFLAKRDFLYQEYSSYSFGTPETNFVGVKRVSPGALCYLPIKTGGYPVVVEYQSYCYRPESTDLIPTIRRSVQNRMENKYDGISVLLSGGLDSNIILHHLLEITEDIEIISVDNQERENIERICDYHGLTPTIISSDFTEDDLKDAVSAYEHSLDYGSLIPNYLLFRACSNSLVFTGDGADELFSGYTRAQEKDTWFFDVWGELPYYHNIRLDRTSMIHTKEARSPLMSYPLLRLSAKLTHDQRRGKRILRDAYRGILPSFITDSDKKPLRHSGDKQLNLDLIQKTHKNIFKL